QHIEQNAVPSDELRQGAAQVGARYPDDLQAWQWGTDHRDLARVREAPHCRRWLLAVAHHHARQPCILQTRQLLLLVSWIHRLKITGLGAAENLDPVGVIEVEMADQALRRLIDATAVEQGARVGLAPQPGQLEGVAVVVEQLAYGDLGHE